MRVSTNCSVFAILLASSVLSLFARPPVEPVSPTCPEGNSTISVQSYSISEISPAYDGQWQGTVAASDGNVYFGASSHSNGKGAGFFKFDPRANRIAVLAADISTVVGENPTVVTPQGKIHSSIEEVDGWLYFGTHIAAINPTTVAKYTGGHVVGYEMATGRFRDLGVLQPNQTIYAGLAADKVRKKLYVFTTYPGNNFRGGPVVGSSPHVFRVDIATGAKQDLGTVGSGSDFTGPIYVDHKGNAWIHAAWDGGLYKARPDRNTLERFPLGREYYYWIAPYPDSGNRYAILMKGAPNEPTTFSIFDPEAPVGRAFHDLATVPATYFVGAALDDTTKTVFYTATSSGAGSYSGGDTLYSFCLDTRRVTSHGTVVDQNGRRPWRLGGMAANGNLFMVGEWYALGGDALVVRNGVPRTGSAGRKVTMRLSKASVGRLCP